MHRLDVGRNPLFDRAVVVGIAVLATLIVINGAISFRNTTQLDADARWVAHTQEVLAACNRARLTAVEQQSALRGFVNTGRDEFLAAFTEAGVAVPQALGDLQRLTGDNPAQQARLKQIEADIRVLQEYMSSVLLQRQQGPLDPDQLSGLPRGHQLMTVVRDRFDQFEAAENVLLKERRERSQKAFRWAVATNLFVALIGLAMMAAFVGLLARSLKLRERAIREIAARRELLQTTLISIGDGVIATDMHGRVSFMNPIATELTGWHEADAIGQPLETVFHIINETTRQPVENPALRALREGVIVGLANHTVLIARDARERPIDDSAAPIRDGAGSVAGSILVFRDITERKRAEEILSEREQFIRRVLDASPGVVYVFDVVAGSTVFINERVRGALGMPSSEVIEQGPKFLQDRCHPEDVEALQHHHERVRRCTTDDVLSVEYRLRHEDGHWVWFISRDTVFQRGLDGSCRQILGVATDITERKESEQLLGESEARFRQLADTMPQMVWMTRPDGYHEYYNRRWYEYIGCTPEECIGFGWNAPLHPDDRQRSIERWQHSLQTGEPYEVEYRFRSKEGEYRWFLGRALPVRDLQGRIVKWFGTCTDIEEFKRVEDDRQKFVSLAENSTDFIAMTNLEGVPFYVNRAGLRMVGLDSLEEARGMHLSDFLFEEDRRTVNEEFLPSVLEKGYGDIEVRFQQFHTSQILWVIYNVFLLSDPQGNRSGFATVSRDITHRRQLEDDLRQLAAHLSEADRRKDEFLATLAHELRNPLAPIRNGLEILKFSEHAGQAIVQARTMMERQLGQMVRLVDDLLDVSRITRNKLELRLETVDLTSIVHSAVETSQPLIEASGHTLEVHVPPESLPLLADHTRLAQVFSNLLNNAAKYTDRGGRITLSVRREGKQVAVSVRDTGVGIPPAMLPKVFDMFTQVDRTLERAQGGLGIGLTLVRRLVDMHNGTVEALSDGPGTGSEFVVRLPLALNRTIVSAEIPDDRTQLSAMRRNILVVDDNEDSANSLRILLEMMGNTVRVAYDGLQALRVAEEFLPDVILLDIGLPKLNGYETCREVRNKPWGDRTVIVACTGWGQEDDRRRAQAAGFDLHMVKPIDPAALERMLSELSHSQSPREDQENRR